MASRVNPFSFNYIIDLAILSAARENTYVIFQSKMFFFYATEAFKAKVLHELLFGRIVMEKISKSFQVTETEL